MTFEDQLKLSTPLLEAGTEPVPGYRLMEKLGRGGFGEVWKADHHGGFHVALKFVRALEGAGSVEIRSLEITKVIHHPNLVHTFGSWLTKEYLIVAMELADRTLWDRFQQARNEGLAGVPRDELQEYILEAGKGIDHLNEHIHVIEGGRRVSIQHRDIKPQNILIIGGGVKVADFGLARVLENTATSHTGSLTPSYAAPEFFNGKTYGQSDQYSLAVTYCHLRGGKLPFSGSPAQVMAGHLMHPPDLAMLPAAERPVLMRALAKEPYQRWPNCRAFAEALRTCNAAQEAFGTACLFPEAPLREGSRPLDTPASAAPPSPAGSGVRASASVIPPSAAGSGVRASTSATPPSPAGTGSGVRASASVLPPPGRSGPHSFAVPPVLDSGSPATLNGPPWIGPAPDPKSPADPAAEQRTGRSRRKRIALVWAPLATSSVIGLSLWAAGILPPAHSRKSPFSPAGTFILAAPARVTVNAGSGGSFEVRIRRENFSGPVALHFAGAPAKVGIGQATIPSDRESVQVDVSAAPDAESGTADVRLFALAGTQRRESDIRLSVIRHGSLLKLVLPAAVSVKAGVPHNFPIRVERSGFDSAVEVMFENIPSKVDFKPLTIPAARDTALAAVTAATDAALGPREVIVRARSGKAESSAALELTVEPAPALSLEVPSELTVEAGETARFPVRLSRSGLEGAAALRFAGIPEGISVRDTTLPAGVSRADVEVAAAATAREQSQTVSVASSLGSATAEAKIQLTIKRRIVGAIRRFMDPKARAWSVAFAADGRRALTGGSDGSIRLWDTESGQELGRFEGHTDRVLSVAFSPDGQRALSGAGFNPFCAADGPVRLWDLQTGKQTRRFEGHARWVASVAFLPDGIRAISGGADATVRLWDSSTGRELRRFAGHTGVVNCVASSRDGLQILSGSADRTVRLWNTETGEELGRFGGSIGEVWSVAFCPDGRRVLSGSGSPPFAPEDNAIRVWDVGSGEELHRFTGHTGAVRSLAIATDGRRALSGSADKTMRLWDLEDGEVSCFKDHSGPVTGVAFSSDGRRALSGGPEDPLRLWGLPR